MTSKDTRVHPLVQRLRHGDEEALGKLFSIYRERLWRMVDLRLDHRLNGRVSPSDVLQETYIDAAKRVDHFASKPDMPFFVWLRWVTNQRLVDLHRRHLGAKMRDAGQEAFLPASPVSLAARLIGGFTSPSQVAMRSEAHGHLAEALGRMEANDREVLALRHFEELSNTEVAEILRITKHAASKRYVRALKRLRDAMSRVSSEASS